MFASRHPSYDSYRHLIGSIITLEGLIGVGKTCLGRSIVKFLENIGFKAKFFPEYVNQKFLDKYIKNMEKYSFAYQVMMLCKRIKIYEDAERFAATGGIAIIDRSLIGDMSFARMQKDKGYFTKQDWEDYLSMAEDEIQLSPTASIFLECSSQISLDRVKRRGVESEIKGYTIEYMDELRNAYIASIKECNNIKHVSIDWSKDIPLTDGLIDDSSVKDVLDKLK